MRSTQVHEALVQGINKFEICCLVSRGVRVSHLKGTRMAESIGLVLGDLAMSPVARAAIGHVSATAQPVPELQERWRQRLEEAVSAEAEAVSLEAFRSFY